MQPLITHSGILIPLNRANIDTDMLLPKQYLKSLDSHGFGNFLFDDERYLDPGEIDTPLSSRRENPDFILNREPYRRGSVVLAQANFGCGSSREHAVWALRDFGVRVIIAPSFGDIFDNNCFNNGVLPLRLPQAEVDQLFDLAQAEIGLQVQVNLTDRMLRVGTLNWVFELEEGRRQRLLSGLDEIGETLQYAEQIKTYEAIRQREEPWVFRS
ncbi:3-isopropylmalate dehydratase small subunit [Pseudomonas sp. G11-1]|uniref:3-isopropylmalate dehydratase small subunit n=1 Tax=Halopseudomonas bauzanensis TaxID=653930 RepID=A0A4U0YR93_9GAMM|nr:MULTISPECIES: 3-isopropylmalate dehydratase small subunit [Halopseudomonas]MCO5785806.1 3-isopropylmalate dehydratase small subunit [Pseudomonas sp. G11-1]MCO5788090.1 3-isopropylmalate dehydratase small subunit [Pseudomonas sp. G11-2]TKA93159.1 3-isopropylmalate dehydratase small subunit [Halopseudomonas bauzanensis]WGK61390.1 3-isopropylmalate dehydratase small subunit [Halopseudomonas sp. SMJS2]